MGSYGLQSVPTGACVQFVDEVPTEEDLSYLASDLRAKQLQVVYVDCELFLDCTWQIPDEIGRQAGTDHPPYSKDQEVSWTRFWDDLISLAAQSLGLVIVLDNAGLVWDRDRKFMTNLVENFLHGIRPWIKQDKPYHLCIQLAAAPSVGKIFKALGSTQ